MYRPVATMIACREQDNPLDAMVALREYRQLERAHAMLLDRAVQAEAKVDRLMAAIIKIRTLPQVNMACDHWSKNMGLTPDKVFDICDEALDAARKEHP